MTSPAPGGYDTAGAQRSLPPAALTTSASGGASVLSARIRHPGERTVPHTLATHPPPPAPGDSSTRGRRATAVVRCSLRAVRGHAVVDRPAARAERGRHRAGQRARRARQASDRSAPDHPHSGVAADRTAYGSSGSIPDCLGEARRRGGRDAVVHLATARADRGRARRPKCVAFSRSASAGSDAGASTPRGQAQARRASWSGPAGSVSNPRGPPRLRLAQSWGADLSVWLSR